MAPNDPNAQLVATDRDEQRVIIEVSGPNVVIRASSQVDRAYTTSLAGAINAAADTDTCIVIDPEPIRCGDEFATYQPTGPDRTCAHHSSCRPAEAEVASPGVVRFRTACSVWLIDVRRGRFCQVDTDIDLRFLGASAWRPLVAVCVTPTRLIVLGVDGDLTSAERAHPTPTA
jgi:hypothetical protein